MKKLFSLVLALMMLLSAASTALAADFPITLSEQAPFAETEEVSLLPAPAHDADADQSTAHRDMTPVRTKANRTFYGSGVYNFTNAFLKYEVGSNKVEYLKSGFQETFFATEYSYTDDLVYGVYSDGNSFHFVRFDDFATEKYTEMSMAPEHIVGLSMDYTNARLYAMSATNILYLVDTVDGSFDRLMEVTGLGNGGMDIPLGMTIATDGTMYVMTYNGTLFTVDRGTGEAKKVGDTKMKANYAQSIVFDHDSQELYWFFCSASGYGDVYTVNTKTAETKLINGSTETSFYGMHARPANIKLPKPVEITDVILTPGNFFAVEGKTYQLRAQVMPLEEYVEDRYVTWSTSDSSVARISSTGLLTAVKAGTVTVTATAADGVHKASCEVTVMSLNEYYRDLSDAVNAASYGEEGYYDFMSIGDYPFEVEYIQGRGTVAHSTNVGQFVTASGIRNIEQIYAIGGSTLSFDAKISCGDYDYMMLQVNGEETDVILNGEMDWATYTYEIPKTDYYTFTWVYVRDWYEYDTPLQDMAWLDNIKIDMMEGADLTGIKVSPEEFEMLIGSTEKLSVSFEPINATNTFVRYRSTNESVLTVDPDGVVTAVGIGNASVIVTSEGGQFTAESKITVVNPKEVNELDFTPIELGNEYDIKLYRPDASWVNIDGRVKYGYGFSIHMEAGTGAEFNVVPGHEYPLPGSMSVRIYDRNFNLVTSQYDAGGYIASCRFLPERTGTYYIVASTHWGFDGGNAIFQAKVYEPVHVNEIKLNRQDLTIGVGRSARLIVKLDPYWNDYSNIEWSCSDNSVISVEKQGSGFILVNANATLYVTGLKEGTATITVTADGKSTSVKVTVVKEPENPKYDERIYAFNVADMTYEYWVGFVAYDTQGFADELELVMPDYYYSNLLAATYYDGLIYAYNYNNMLDEGKLRFEIFDPASLTLQESVIMATPQYLPMDMTYDYTTDTAYAIVWDQLTGDYVLATADLNTGEFTPVATIELDGVMLTIAATTEGLLYCCSDNGDLYLIEKPTADLVFVANLGYTAFAAQSMVYNNFDRLMYWFQLGGDDLQSHLIAFDPATGKVQKVESLGSGSMEVTSAFIYGDPDDFPDAVPVSVEGVSIKQDNITLGLAQSVRLQAMFSPYNATNRNLTWSSNNPYVATVDELGNVYANHAGTAYIEVTTEDGGFVARTLVTVNNVFGSDIPLGMAKITLKADDVWGDGTGYQMLLDEDAYAFEDGIIPLYTGLTDHGSADESVYSNFEYKLPENADGELNTKNVLVRGELSVYVEAGVYDWCITNPVPGDRVYIAVNGRGDNYKFEAGRSYTFEVVATEESDDVIVTAEYVGFKDPKPELETYTVTFQDFEGNTLSTYVLKDGESAYGPTMPEHPEGIPVIAWSADIDEVHENLTVKPVTLGDVNRTGVIDAGDATLVLRSAIGATELSDTQKLLANANQNDAIEAGDATIILRYAVGMPWPEKTV